MSPPAATVAKPAPTAPNPTAIPETALPPASAARGILDELVPATATKPAHLVLSIPGTSYRIHLRYTGEVMVAPGKRLSGIIHAEVRRVDRIPGGGRFVEPVFGRPRRVQGMVLGNDPSAGTITVDAGGSAVPGFEKGLPIVCRLTDPRQHAAEFFPGQMVCADVLDGATITVM